MWLCHFWHPQQEFAPSCKASEAEATEQCFEPDSATLGGRLGFTVSIGLSANKVESFRRAGSIPHCGNKKMPRPERDKAFLAPATGIEPVTTP